MAKRTISLVLFLFLLNVEVFCRNLNGCDYINGNNETVEIQCWSSFAQPVRKTSCYWDLFHNSSSTIYRSRVKLLQFPVMNYRSDCSDDDIGPFVGFFGNIRVLDYSRTRYYPLHTNLTFRYLEVFNASHKTIRFLSKEIFSGQPNLRQIDFSHNNISEIRSATFDQNRKLSVINIANNMLSSLEAHIFSKLNELSVVDVSVNQIEWIDENAFCNNHKLTTLNLKTNPLNRLDCNMFSPLKSLQNLEATLNNIEELDLSCNGSELIASDDEKEITIKLPTVKNTFYCPMTQLAHLRHFNIAGLKVNNTENILQRLGSNLELLDISSNNFNNITFDRFHNLRTLKLSNMNLSTLDPEIFDIESLLELDISWNKLSNFDFSLISTVLIQLEALSIAGNNIESVPELLLLLSPSIQSIDLSYNRVGKLNADTFRRFTGLQYLNLSSTNLTNFKFEAVYHLTKLRALDISHNELVGVDFELFTRVFNELSVFILEDCLLSDVDTITPTKFPKLSILGISKNYFTCRYLAPFLDQWPSLQLIRNPSATKNIDGVDCDRVFIPPH